MTQLTTFYHRYPKDPIANLKWRRYCRLRAIDDKRFRYALYDACMLDVLFFMGFAMWSFEPRAKQKIRPFIPWPHQEPVFVAMDNAIDDAERSERSLDVILDKSRAQGGTFGMRSVKDFARGLICCLAWYSMFSDTERYRSVVLG